jgi:hypothetical protein
MIIRFLLVAVLAAGFALAQDDEGGGGGGGGRGGGDMGGGGMSPMMNRPTTLDRIATQCKFDNNAKKSVKATIDAAFKDAAALRKQIPLTRDQIAQAVQAGKSPEEIKQLTDTQGTALAEVKQLELKAFATIYNTMSADQKKASGQMLFASLNGLLLKKNWNE